ncbi:MAG: hypothetical protein LBK52_01680, partial [Deltaproteobacteria bacterium]|nr:hypothetical protein [Deltaproteobacteria bacterium]
GAAQAMFSNFSPIISAKTLCYFEGGDLHLIKGEVKEVLINAVKNIDFFNIPKKTIISQDLTEKFLKQS